MIEAYNDKVLLIDKPLEWTSFDVVKKVRATYRLKKVGHAGTLDPLATGLLIICTGKKTKEIEGFMGQEKEYTGKLTLGKTTPSVDLETSFDKDYDIGHIDNNTCLEVAKSFVGAIEQVPPIYSAIRVKGRRAYEHAREGSETKLKSRTVSIAQFDLEKIELPDIYFRVICSKGTYIRSLVRDFGTALDAGAYLAELRRTRIGDYRIEDALTIDKIKR